MHYLFPSANEKGLPLLIQPAECRAPTLHTSCLSPVNCRLADIDQAESYALHDHKDKALDICWKLRLAPDLSLWNRALVNLLIANIVDLKEKPDAAKYADECIALIEQLHIIGLKDPEDAHELTRMRLHAEKVKEGIEKDLRALGITTTPRPSQAQDGTMAGTNSTISRAGVPRSQILKPAPTHNEPVEDGASPSSAELKKTVDTGPIEEHKIIPDGKSIEIEGAFNLYRPASKLICVIYSSRTWTDQTGTATPPAKRRWTGKF